MKMKFVSLLALSLVFSASPQAGFYAGGTFGFARSSMDNRADALNNAGNVVFNFGKKDSKSRFVPGLLAGYSFELSPCWFVSPELSALFVNAEQSSSETFVAGGTDYISKTSAKIQTVLGLGARLGYQMPSGLGLFGKLGVEFAQLKTKGEIVDKGGKLVDGSKLNQSNWKPGLAIGAGLETKMGGVIVRGDYTFSLYKGTGEKILKEPTGDDIYSHKLSGVRSHRVMVSFVVPFGK